MNVTQEIELRLWKSYGATDRPEDTLARSVRRVRRRLVALGRQAARARMSKEARRVIENARARLADKRKG